MDSSEQLIAEADLLLEQSSLRLKQARSREEAPGCGKDSLLVKCKDAIEQLTAEILEEKKARAVLEESLQQLQEQLTSAEAEAARLKAELAECKSNSEEAVRKAAKKKEEEMRDFCAMKEAKMKLELKGIIADLEEELTASTAEHQRVRESNERLAAELTALQSQLALLSEENSALKTHNGSTQVAQVSAKLTAEMQKRLQDKAEFKAILQRDKTAMIAKVEEKDRLIQSLRQELSERCDTLLSAQQVVSLTAQVKEERMKRLQAERELLVMGMQTVRRQLFEQQRQG